MSNSLCKCSHCLSSTFSIKKEIHILSIRHPLLLLMLYLDSTSLPSGVTLKKHAFCMAVIALCCSMADSGGVKQIASCAMILPDLLYKKCIYNFPIHFLDHRLDVVNANFLLMHKLCCKNGCLALWKYRLKPINKRITV